MSGETFLERWSRLKAGSRREAPPSAPAEEALPAPPDAAKDEPAPPALPAIEDLTAESDYTAFLRPGVPEETKLAALRKLWTSDPTLSAPDPLDLHNFDYTFPAVPEVVQTAYKVGKGFVDAVEKALDQTGAAKEAEAAEKKLRDSQERSSTTT